MKHTIVRMLKFNDHPLCYAHRRWTDDLKRVGKGWMMMSTSMLPMRMINDYRP